jgi:hypothetical protein
LVSTNHLGLPIRSGGVGYNHLGLFIRSGVNGDNHLGLLILSDYHERNYLRLTASIGALTANTMPLWFSFSHNPFAGVIAITVRGATTHVSV